MTTLPRWIATWSDGVTRVIHAETRQSALELARSLTSPTPLVSVEAW